MITVKRALIVSFLITNCIGLFAMKESGKTNEKSVSKISIEDKKEILAHIKQIKFAFQMGPTFVMGSGRSLNSFIESHTSIIEQVLNRNNINHPYNKTLEWIHELEKELIHVEQIIVARDENSNVCDISGLKKDLVLKALFKRAKPKGLGMLDYNPKDTLNDEEVAGILKGGYVDYLKGRLMKVDLGGDTLDTFDYNRGNGRNSAEKVIKKLRKSKKNNRS